MIRLSTAEAGILQTKAYRALRQFMGQCLGPHDISLTGWALLGKVAHTHGIRASVLAADLSVKRPLVTEMLREFESKGLLTRRTDPADSRAKQIVLTDKGAQFVQDLERELRSELHGFLHDISVDDLAIYLKVLRIIADKLENDA